MGLMGVIADSALSSGGHVVGVITRALATKELAQFLKVRNPDDWPSKVMRFLMAQLSEADFLKAAQSKEAKTDRELKCVAYFYAGTRRLIDADKETARKYFEKCIETGVKNFTEYQSAEAELKALSN